jgi:hypothetical protein
VVVRIDFILVVVDADCVLPTLTLQGRAVEHLQEEWLASKNFSLAC